MEKAYYIYIELGKILNQNPKFIFANKKGQKEHYHDKIDEEYYGICKSMSELYVRMLKDSRVGISADLVKREPESDCGHIDTILKIDGKNYIANLIIDLSRIKTSRRTNRFCFDFMNYEDYPRAKNNPKVQEEVKEYKKRLESHYGKIDSLTKQEMEQLDKKIGYSFFIPRFSQENERGLYTDDVIKLLKQDMENPESFKKYVLQNKEVPEEEWLKYKLDYIFENINKFTDYNGKMQYLENIRYYGTVERELLSLEERERIHAYAVTVGDDMSNILSIIKVKPVKQQNDVNHNLYYLYSRKDRKYIEKTPEEMRQFMDGLNQDSLRIIGTFDKFNPREMEELEL